MSLSALILSSSLGSETAYGMKRDVPASSGYNKARVDDTKSYYVVYKEPEFNDVHYTAGSVIVETTTDVSIGWNVRSFQGFDKTGIALFEHHNYGGTGRNYTTSAPDITYELPDDMGDAGASSMIVSKGVWSLYTEKNYNGTKIAINGKDEFGPGTRIEGFGAADDKVKSVKYIREN